MYTSTGVLRYSEDNGKKLIVEVDPDLANYYRRLIPKYFDVKRGKYDAHITVVRSYKETPPDLTAWGKYEGHEIDFLYEPIIRQGKIYWWLNVLCSRLEKIRLELGLEVSSPWTRPPEGFEKYFHITLGNTKV